MLQVDKVSLERIFSNLLKGEVYGARHVLMGTDFFQRALWYDKKRQVVYWKHYGNGAFKLSKANLLWAVRNVFNMAPEKFTEIYSVESGPKVYKL